jgi:hypothetical protein
MPLAMLTINDPNSLKDIWTNLVPQIPIGHVAQILTAWFRKFLFCNCDSALLFADP